MRAAGKIIVFSSLFLLIMAGLLASAVLYLYRHPEIVTVHVEKYLSDAAGLEIRADRLEWSIRPLHIEASGFSISSHSNPDAFRIQIPKLASRMHLDGPFGRRTLVVDYVEAQGLSVKIREMDFKGSWKPSERDGTFLKVLGRLAGFVFFKDIFLREISINEGDVDVRFESLDLVIARLSAHRSPEGRITIEGEAEARLQTIEGVLSAPYIQLTLQPGLSFPAMRVSSDLEIKDAQLEISQEKVPGICGRFNFDVDFVQKTITASSAVISAGNILKFEGSLEGRHQPRPTFEVNAERCVVELSDLPSFISKTLHGMKPSGSLYLSGRAGGALVNERWSLEGDMEASTEAAAFSWETDGAHFAGVISGTADFSVDSSGFPSVSSGGLVLSKGTFSNDAGMVDFVDTEVRFSGGHPEYDVERFSVRIPRAVFARVGKGLPFDTIHVTGSNCEVDLNRRTIDFPEISISLPSVGNFSARGRISPETSQFSVEGKNAGLVPLALKFGLVPAEWEVSGKNRVQFNLSLNPKRTAALNSKILLQDFSFQDPTGRFIGEGLSATLDFDGRMDLKTESISGELSAGAAQGELLLGLFYLDFARNPFRSRGELEFLINKRRARIGRYRLGFENLFDLVLEGTANIGSGTSTRVAVHLDQASLSPLYDLLVREPLGRRVPLLDELRPEGKISADMELSYTSGNLFVTGGVGLREGLFSASKKELFARDINLDLPVWIEIGQKEKRGYADLKTPTGRFSAAEFRFPFFPLQGMAFAIEAARNGIRIPVPLGITIPGGRIEFGTSRAADILREGFKAETSIRVTSKDLSPLLSRIWPREINATLEGLLDPVVLENNRISTRGSLRGNVFGGTVSISRVKAERIFSASPLLKLSLDFSDIDLGKLTGDTPFGRIDGIMKGYIRNLEIVGNQPQHFDMLLETTEKGSQRQKISIKAVENISRIGAGESPFSGFGGVLTSFFETLGYEKIGVMASLNNDYFTIKGTIKEDGNEYIMKRGGISGVNIINRNPDNRIRFKDMVNRIKRVIAEER
jgi:hypothetical protein